MDIFIKFADWLVYSIIKIPQNTTLGSSIHFFVYDVSKILFLLFIIILLISFFRNYINNEKIQTYIEKQPKIIAHFLASLFGAITPFCSCSSIPIFIGFIEAKISFGVTMSFLITSPMINEIAITVLAGIIGWKITIIYMITGITVGTFGGIIIEKFGWNKYLQDYLINNNNSKINSCNSCNQNQEKLTIKENVLNSLENTKEIIGKIWLFVLLGVGIGAFLHGYVPQEFFIKYLGNNNLFAVPLAVLVGIPLYSDATTIIPIAQVLINKGSAIGTVLIFMMSIVALSLPEMIILSRVMKKELIIRFVLFMFFTFIIVGYLYNFIL